MTDRIICLLAMICIFASASAHDAHLPADSVHHTGHQAVGLVLSGGGAKGIAHIAVIKALEENNIPIDYIAGTSMGAVVGGLYAAGYTPDEMMALIKSEGFADWSTGKIDPDYLYYFDREPSSPAMVKVNLGSSGNGRPVSVLPTSLINPLPMNFAFMDLFAAYTAQCGGDFDRLFVPLRTVTSDVYSKHKIVLSHGSLGDAVRASMSFPLVFRPIEIDSVLVYDGGIYDNYPFNVMRTDFAPDIMIGSNVSGPDKKPQQNNVLQQLEDMIIQNNDYDMPADWGVSINVPVRMYGVLDFDKADTIYAIGYRAAMEMMDSIKTRVTTRIPSEVRQIRRMAFKAATPYVRFDSVSVEGGTSRQNEFIRYLFTHNTPDTFGIKRARDSYYRAITPGKLENLVPQAVYDDSTGMFDLRLKANVKNNFQVAAGGYVSTSTSSMLYFSGGYNTLSFNSLTTSANIWLGQSYQAALIDARFSLLTHIPSALRFQAVASRQKFHESDELFFQDNIPIFVTDTELFGRISYVMSAGRPAKIEFGVGAGLIKNRFFPTSETDVRSSLRDHTYRHLVEGHLAYEYNTLDNINYPTSGSHINIRLTGATGRYRFEPAGTDRASDISRHTVIGQAEVKATHYFTIGRKAALGTEVQALISNRGLQSGYGATLVMAPSYTPTPSTYNSFNPALRANSFVTASMVPIWKISSSVQLRTTLCAFMPYRRILENPDGTARYGRRFDTAHFFGESALAFTLPFATLSAYANYCSYPARNWNFGISLGLFVLAPRFLH